MFGFLKNIFCGEEESAPVVKKIEKITDSPWGVEVFDIQAIFDQIICTTTDQQQAENSMSYNSTDGHEFANEFPENKRESKVELSYPIRDKLYPGILFTPEAMEQKWAIFYHDNSLIFVRSWLREVFVRAETTIENNQLIINKIIGDFDEDEPDLTPFILNYLMISHVFGEVFPVPIPGAFEDDIEDAADWAFTLFGNMAICISFEHEIKHEFRHPLSTITNLHIAVAKQDTEKIRKLIDEGMPIDVPCINGSTPLAWAVSTDGLDIAKQLIELGADVNKGSFSGTTPLMSAVEEGNLEFMELLLDNGADINQADDRGFTCLHRSSEIGHVEVTEFLLSKGANPNVEALGHTPISLAEQGESDEIKEMLLNANAQLQ
jgi:hypothetical protein